LDGGIFERFILSMKLPALYRIQTELFAKDKVLPAMARFKDLD
jgi:hypothetical protein